MQAAVCHALGEPLAVEVSVALPKAGEVCVRVVASARGEAALRAVITS